MILALRPLIAVLKLKSWDITVIISWLFALFVDLKKFDSWKDLVQHVGWVSFPFFFPWPNGSQDVYLWLLKISRVSKIIKNQSEENNCFPFHFLPPWFLKTFMYYYLKFQGFLEELMIKVKKINPHIVAENIESLQKGNAFLSLSEFDQMQVKFLKEAIQSLSTSIGW